MHRHKLSKRSSKRMFKHTADAHHKRNYHPTPMRGGYRL